MRRMSGLGVVLAAAVVVAACDSGTDPGDGPRVSVFLTDAPGDVDAVWIDLAEVSLIGDGLDDVDLPLEVDGLIELTELQDELQELSDDVDVPDFESYAQIRLMVDGVVLRTRQGEYFSTDDADLPLEAAGEEIGELQCPSCFQTGIKLVLQGAGSELEEGEEDVAVVLDFDVAQSFAHPAGSSGRWVLRPVIHVRVMEEPSGAGVDDSAIEGEVVIQLVQGVPAFTIPTCAGAPRALDDFIPTATAVTLEDGEGNPLVLSGEVEADGDFSIDLVPEDSWNLGYLATDLGAFELVWTATISPASVTVTGDEDETGVVYTLTGVTCRAKP